MGVVAERYNDLIDNQASANLDIARAVEVFKRDAHRVDSLTDERRQVEATYQREKALARLGTLKDLVTAGIRSGETVIRLGHMKQAISEASERAQGIAAAVEEVIACLDRLGVAVFEQFGKTRIVA